MKLLENFKSEVYLNSLFMPKIQDIGSAPKLLQN